MSEKEKNIVEKLKDAIPKMSDFDKGYILGKVENMAEQKEKKHKDAEEFGVQTVKVRILKKGE